MRKALLTITLALATLAANAQKALYIPAEWKEVRTDTLLYKESDPDNKYTWSKSRSVESDNFIIYWDKYYGSTAPNKLASSNFYYVDLEDLLEKAEWFYELNVTKLGFGGENSKLDKYKSMILINHTTTWAAYGGGYDFQCPALWINPATCKPVGHTIAHEIGHSFQYMGYSDLGGHAGFHDAIGNGSGWWEQTAQWQAAQAYPEQKWNESWLVYSTPYFPRTANYAMTHEWMRYQSYWWHYYLVEHYNDRTIIGQLWRHPMSKAADPNEVLMDLKGIDATELYRLYFDYAMKMATMDIDVDNIKEEGILAIENFPYTYNCLPLGGNKYQVAYSSCPQSTGFNVIPLNVPEAGTVISTDFTSLKLRTPLADGDPKEYINDKNQYAKTTSYYYNSVTDYNKLRGFRLGYVALLKDGTRQYIYEDKLYCADDNKPGDKTVTVSATVPENVDKMWLVVSPAPRSYIQHRWDENIGNDDQWPYTVEFHGTNISGMPTIDENLPVTDATITFNVNLVPTTGNNYAGASVVVRDAAASALGTAFQMQPSEVASHLTAWSSADPVAGKMKFYPINPTTGTYANSGSTANGYGHWFTATGASQSYGTNSRVYSEFAPATLTFTVGPYPGRLKVGDTYTIGQALRYHRNESEPIAMVKFIFNVTCVSASVGNSYQIASVEQSPLIEEILTGIEALPANPAAQGSSTLHPTGYYTLSGTRLSTPQRGINLVKYNDGTTKKVLVK